MARTKKITVTKISGIVGDIGKILSKYSADNDELNWVRNEIRLVLESAVKRKKPSSAIENLSGVVDPRNIARTGAEVDGRGSFIRQKSDSQRSDAVKGL